MTELIGSGAEAEALNGNRKTKRQRHRQALRQSMALIRANHSGTADQLQAAATATAAAQPWTVNRMRAMAPLQCKVYRFHQRCFPPVVDAITVIETEIGTETETESMVVWALRQNFPCHLAKNTMR